MQKGQWLSRAETMSGDLLQMSVGELSQVTEMFQDWNYVMFGQLHTFTKNNWTGPYSGWILG